MEEAVDINRRDEARPHRPVGVVGGVEVTQAYLRRRVDVAQDQTATRPVRLSHKHSTTAFA